MKLYSLVPNHILSQWTFGLLKQELWSKRGRQQSQKGISFNSNVTGVAHPHKIFNRMYCTVVERKSYPVVSNQNDATVYALFSHRNTCIYIDKTWGPVADLTPQLKC